MSCFSTLHPTQLLGERVRRRVLCVLFCSIMPHLISPRRAARLVPFDSAWTPEPSHLELLPLNSLVLPAAVSTLSLTFSTLPRVELRLVVELSRTLVLDPP